MSDLKGKRVLITGSTSGIGLGFAEGFAEAGCDVMLNGFGDADQIEKDRAALEKDHGIRAFYNGADMTDPDQIKAMCQDAKDRMGGVDILINNAGIQHVEKIEDFPREKWDAIIAIILSSSFHTTQACVPMMREAGWGRIINLASAHALVASPYKAAYVAAKHGMAGLTKVVALEVARDNITCNAICPGYVKTPLVENQIADTARARGIPEDRVIEDVILLNLPTKTFVEIEELADFAKFLCSRGGNGINGAILSADGGWSAQ
ncbi:MAG: 3-hydroxybutyrate dehydrogenase [Alphaproteobacteria bacterium]